MIKMLSLFILSLFSAAYAQKASFKEIKLKPNPKVYAPEGASIIYPIIVTANPQADKLMNAAIKAEVLEPGKEKQTTRALLLEHINEYNLIDLSYEVTYNKNYILSLYVYAEGCGAYCSSGNTYFNFDLKTGKKVSIADLIVKEMLDSFKNMVFLDKTKALQKYKIEEIDELKQGNIDSAIYNWAMEEVDGNCGNSVSLENFSISDVLMEITDHCEFPNAIKSQTPAYELKYPYASLQFFLKPKFKKMLK